MRCAVCGIAACGLVLIAVRVGAVAGEREYLTCERCADYRALPTQELDAVRGLIEHQFGYRASFIHFPIVGLCPSCAAELSDRPLPHAAHS